MAKHTILVVDDEPANLAVFSQLLQPHYQVRACKSGQQALSLLGRPPYPDLILLDVMMPGMDGHTVLSELRRQPSLWDIPTIFVTALNEAHDEETGLRLGAVDYITKPVNPGIMLARIGTHLELKQARDQLRDQNAWLEGEVERRTRENLITQDISMSMLLQLAETRDDDTGNHILRVQAYVEALGQALQAHPEFKSELTPQYLNHIVRAAPLHDIGKIGIPDSILLKPGKLTPVEWSTMKDHTRIGERTIRRAIDRALDQDIVPLEPTPISALAMLEVACSIAAHHHERWDGSGYPQGLAGEAIPLPARMMAIADVYDALTMQRPYKAPWSREAASQHILEQSGKHFDPQLTACFATIQDRFAGIQARLADPKMAQTREDSAS